MKSEGDKRWVFWGVIYNTKGPGLRGAPYLSDISATEYAFTEPEERKAPSYWKLGR